MTIKSGKLSKLQAGERFAPFFINVIPANINFVF